MTDNNNTHHIVIYILTQSTGLPQPLHVLSMEILNYFGVASLHDYPSSLMINTCPIQFYRIIMTDSNTSVQLRIPLNSLHSFISQSSHHPVVHPLQDSDHCLRDHHLWPGPHYVQCTRTLIRNYTGIPKKGCLRGFKW